MKSFKLKLTILASSNASHVNTGILHTKYTIYLQINIPVLLNTFEINTVR